MKHLGTTERRHLRVFYDHQFNKNKLPVRADASLFGCYFFFSLEASALRLLVELLPNGAADVVATPPQPAAEIN